MFPTGFEIAYQKLLSGLFERWLGIRTTGKAEATTSEGIHYTPLPYVMIRRMLRSLALDKQDVFVDIGCGKGRVLCCAARFSLKRVVGVELNGELVRIAKDNLLKLRGVRTPAEVVHVSAEDYAYSDATVIYLYNPFNRRITQHVMELIHSSWREIPRRVRVVYANPVHEEVMSEKGWLRKSDEWPASAFPGFGYPVSFWTTK